MPKVTGLGKRKAGLELQPLPSFLRLPNCPLALPVPICFSPTQSTQVCQPVLRAPRCKLPYRPSNSAASRILLTPILQASKLRLESISKNQPFYHRLQTPLLEKQETAMAKHESFTHLVQISCFKTCSCIIPGKLSKPQFPFLQNRNKNLSLRPCLRFKYVITHAKLLGQQPHPFVGNLT